MDGWASEPTNLSVEVAPKADNKEVLIFIIIEDKEPYKSKLAVQQSTWIPLARVAGYTVEIFNRATVGSFR